jgi:hypothetical protein
MKKKKILANDTWKTRGDRSRILKILNTWIGMA